MYMLQAAKLLAESFFGALLIQILV